MVIRRRAEPLLPQLYPVTTSLQWTQLFLLHLPRTTAPLIPYCRELQSPIAKTTPTLQPQTSKNPKPNKDSLISPYKTHSGSVLTTLEHLGSVRIRRVVAKMLHDDAFRIKFAVISRNYILPPEIRSQKQNAMTDADVGITSFRFCVLIFVYVF